LHIGDDCKQPYLALYSTKERCLPKNAEMCCTISELELPVNTLPDKIVPKKSLKVKGLNKMLREGITIEESRRIQIPNSFSDKS
jgi:hypothetical protein